MKIRDLKDKMPLNYDPLLVVAVKDGVSNNGAPYLSITLQDNTGVIEGKFWDVAPIQKQLIQAGHIVSFHGNALLYRGTLQLKLDGVQSVDESMINWDEFVSTGPIKKEVLVQEIDEVLSSIENPTLHLLVNGVFEDVRDKFFTHAAAAKNHHEFVSGLATHTVEMVRIGESLCRLFPVLNRDLLMSGILVHDVGKLYELSDGIVPEYTTEGKLLGHISIMQAILAQKAKELQLDDEMTMLLRHMVLSHHGEYEFGSPVLPMIPEAEALHLIDNMDARLEMMRKALESVREGEFTPRIFSLENRQIYKMKK